MPILVNNLVIRADASTEIGTGHIMRCLALAQGWQVQGGQVTFVLANKSPTTADKLLFEGMQVVYLSVAAGRNEDARQTADFAQQFAAQWLIVDGYHFGADYQQAIKDFGINLLFIDDYGHADHYYANLVLNQNISANQDLYTSREPYTKLLLGLKYTLLRREFWQWRDWSRVIQPIASKLLVTLGGSDPDNVTLKVVQALQLLNNDLEIIVVIGGSNPNYAVLQREITDSRVTISLQRNVNNMPELMAWADIAIAAGGSTNWELAFMGLPSIVITLADNQIAIASELAARNLIVHLGWYQQITLEQIGLAVESLIKKPNQREEMSKIGRELIDGNGANLVASQMFNMLA